MGALKFYDTILDQLRDVTRDRYPRSSPPPPRPCKTLLLLLLYRFTPSALLGLGRGEVGGEVCTWKILTTLTGKIFWGKQSEENDFITTLQATMRLYYDSKCLQRFVCYLQVSTAKPVRSFVYGNGES